MLETTWHTFLRRRATEEAIAYIKCNEEQFLNCQELNWLSQQVKDKFSQVLSCSDNLSSELKLQFITEVMNAMQIGSQIIIPISKQQQQQNLGNMQQGVPEESRQQVDQNFQLIDVDSSIPTSFTDRDYHIILQQDEKVQEPNGKPASFIHFHDFFKSNFSVILGYSQFFRILSVQGVQSASNFFVDYFFKVFSAVSFVPGWNKQETQTNNAIAQNNNTEQDQTDEWDLVGFDDFVAEQSQQVTIGSENILNFEDLSNGDAVNDNSQSITQRDAPLIDVPNADIIPQAGPSHQNLLNPDQICSTDDDSTLANFDPDQLDNLGRICSDGVDTAFADINPAQQNIQSQVLEEALSCNKNESLVTSNLQVLKGEQVLEHSQFQGKFQNGRQGTASQGGEKCEFDLLKESSSGEVMEVSFTNSVMENGRRSSSEECLWGCGIVGSQEIATFERASVRRYEYRPHRSRSQYGGSNFRGGRGGGYRRGASYFQNSRNFQWVQRYHESNDYRSSYQEDFVHEPHAYEGDEFGRYNQTQSYGGNFESPPRNSFGYQQREQTIRGRFSDKQEEGGSTNCQMDHEYQHY